MVCGIPAAIGLFERFWTRLVYSLGTMVIPVIDSVSVASSLLSGKEPWHLVCLRRVLEKQVSDVLLRRLSRHSADSIIRQCELTRKIPLICSLYAALGFELIVPVVWAAICFVVLGTAMYVTLFVSRAVMLWCCRCIGYGIKQDAPVLPIEVGTIKALFKQFTKDHPLVQSNDLTGHLTMAYVRAQLEEFADSVMKRLANKAYRDVGGSAKRDTLQTDHICYLNITVIDKATLLSVDSPSLCYHRLQECTDPNKMAVLSYVGLLHSTC
ncbi:hypothetical protein ACOME3_002323 [Neoechinorhynchus agilis]